MKKMLLVSLLLLSLAGSSQSVEQLLSGKRNCAEIDLVALDIIPGYYQRGQLDSIELILDFVAYKCVESASLRLTRFLLLIQQHRFSDTLLTPLDLHYIKKEGHALRRGHLYDFKQMYYTHLADGSSSSGSGQDVMWRQSMIEDNYIAMLRQWTNELRNRSDNDKLESAVIAHMTPFEDRAAFGSGGLWNISSRRHGYLTLPQVYNRYHRDFVILRSWQLTLAAGSWQPFGAWSSIMGPRTALQFSLGKVLGNSKHRIDFGGYFPLGRLQRPFLVQRPDTSFTSNSGYFSYAWLDYVRTLWRPNRFFEWNASLGIGIAEKGVYKPLAEDETEEGEPNERINNKMGDPFILKPALFLGTEFKCFVASGVALNVQARYMLHNLGSIGGTSFRGSAVGVSAGLSFHFGGHPARQAVSLASNGNW
jgi:hypothetical protein